MAQDLLGRTNKAFPRVWLSLSAPGPDAEPHEREKLVDFALSAGCPIDISSQPALWGGRMRGADVRFMSLSGFQAETAVDEKHASDLVQAHLIETLCALGVERLEFYFLRIRLALEEFQINGALSALEMARQEGHIGSVGICCDGPALATLGVWQFHDAFEVLLVPRNHYDGENYKTLAPLAKERRVGIVTSRPLNWGYGLPFVAMPQHWRLRNLTQSFFGLSLAQAVVADLSKDHPVLVGVRTEEEARAAIETQTKTLPEGLTAMLEPFVKSFDSQEAWNAFLGDENPLVRAAAQRRLCDRG